MPSVFNPRDVEVLAAALPPQGVNPIGGLTRDILVLHAKRSTPGHYSQLIGTGPAFRTVFFPRAAESTYEAAITGLTGLDGQFFSGLAVAMLCQRISQVTTRLRPQMQVQPIAEALASSTARVRRSSYRFYAHMAAYADSPIRTALAAFRDEHARALARQHYLAGLTSPTWVNDKLLQDASHDWQDRDWELYHHWIKLTALGASVGEIDTAIRAMEALKLEMPPALKPGVWHTHAPWLVGDLGGSDMADANEPILATRCHPVPGGMYPSCIAEDNSYEFTANSQPGTVYRRTPSSSCFAPGTRVVMADATLRPIEDVAVGDEVATPSGPRAVILRPGPLRGERTLVQFAGTGFAFAESHPFLVDPGGSPAPAAYAAADPEGLARDVPTLSQFGIRPLGGPDPAVLLRHEAGGDVPFPAPEVHQVPDLVPELLYDLYLDTGDDGRSEYYAGDDRVQLLVSSEIPRYAAAPQTTAVVLQVLAQAGPAVLRALAGVPDRSFGDLLGVGLDSLARTLMPAVGPRLLSGGDSEPAPLPRSAPELALLVRDFAASLGGTPQGYDQRTGVLVEQFAARFAPQFQAALALPWRTFDLAEADTATILAVTPYSVELFAPGPPADTAEVELTLLRGPARHGRRLPVRPGSPADRWYYTVDVPAYFPQWSLQDERDPLWHLEIAVRPGSSPLMVLALPRDIAHGYQAFCAPLLGAGGAVAGQAWLDVRLLTTEGYAAEARDRAAAGGQPAGRDATADRLAQLAARFVEQQFAHAVSAFRYCAATTRTP